jgi:hypothetical protein
VAERRQEVEEEPSGGRVSKVWDAKTDVVWPIALSFNSNRKGKSFLRG